MLALLSIFTLWNFYTAFSYIYTLEQWLKSKEYVFWDEWHSLQHISIAWLTILVSLGMFFLTINGQSNEATELLYIAYNGALAFVIYPHIISER